MATPASGWLALAAPPRSQTMARIPILDENDPSLGNRPQTLTAMNDLIQAVYARTPQWSPSTASWPI